MVYTSIGLSHFPEVSFTGGDPYRPLPREGVGVCRLEQLPQLITAFRATVGAPKQLDASSLSKLANILIGNVRTPTVPTKRRIEGYSFIAEHHIDTFLGCKIYLGEGEPIKEQVWIKEYEQVLASPEQRSEREQLVLRHADVLHRFPQHKNIVHYRIGKSSASHLYVILTRTPGAFLSELLSGKPLGSTVQVGLERIPFDLHARLRILGDLLHALEYITQQPGFEKSAYRDMRPDSIFVQYTGSTPVAQLFNFDCTKLPGTVTKRDYLKEGRERSPAWETYASPELLVYIESGSTTSEGLASFTGDVKSDIFSWAVIAWQMLAGSLPFPDAEAKLTGRRRHWSDPPTFSTSETDRLLTPEHVHMIKACLELDPSRRPNLQTLIRYFP